MRIFRYCATYAWWLGHKTLVPSCVSRYSMPAVNRARRCPQFAEVELTLVMITCVTRPNSEGSSEVILHRSDVLPTDVAVILLSFSSEPLVADNLCLQSRLASVPGDPTSLACRNGDWK